MLKPLLSAKDSGRKRVGVLLMGTVRGDLHDIGKNLVCMMAEGAGFEVHDIGVDQSVEKFMAAADKCNPTIIGMSALLTTTMTYMKTVIDGFEAAGRGHIKMADRRRADQPDVRRRNRRRRLRPERLGRGRSVPAPRRRRRRRRSPPPRRQSRADDSRVEGNESTYKILYWQEIPSQIKAEDDAGNDVSVELDRQVRRAHRRARRRSAASPDADDYSAQWKWSDEEERDGSAQDVAEAVKAELEAAANW